MEIERGGTTRGNPIGGNPIGGNPIATRMLATKETHDLLVSRPCLAVQGDQFQANNITDKHPTQVGDFDPNYQHLLPSSQAQQFDLQRCDLQRPMLREETQRPSMAHCDDSEQTIIEASIQACIHPSMPPVHQSMHPSQDPSSFAEHKQCAPMLRGDTTAIHGTVTTRSKQLSKNPSKHASIHPSMHPSIHPSQI